MPTKRTTLPALPNLAELDTSAMGEATRALTALQRGYAVGVAVYGLDSAAAARAAGYSESFCVHHAYELAAHEGIKAAILELGKSHLRGEGARSILVMCKIRDDEAVKPDVRLRAAEMIANRSGFHITTEHHEHVHTHVSNDEADRRILALAAELGMSPDQAKLMLIAPAEFERNSEGVFEMAAKPLSGEPRAVAQRATRARRKGMSPAEIDADKARIQSERAAVLRRERQEHEARRAGVELETDPFADIEY